MVAGVVGGLSYVGLGICGGEEGRGGRCFFDAAGRCGIREVWGGGGGGVVFEREDGWMDR